MRSSALVAVALVLAACGGGVSSDELDAVADERNLAQVRLTESQVAIAQLEDQVMTLEEKLQAAEIRAEIAERQRATETEQLDVSLFWKVWFGNYDEAWSSEDVDRIMELYDRRVVYQIVVGGTVRSGRDDVRLSFTNYLGMFDDYRHQTEDYEILDRTSALATWEASGRNLDGELVRLSGGSRFHVDDEGLIVRQIEYRTLP